MVQMIPVVAGIIGRPDDNKVLIQRRTTGEWEFPGGKIEPGEQPKVALRRELEEELGLYVEIYQPVHVLTNDTRREESHYVVIFYKCLTIDFPKKGSNWAWIHPGEIPNFDLIHPNMLEALHRSL